MGFFSSMFRGNDTNITPQKAKQMMEEGGRYVLLDVRTPAEYRQIRIDGAKLIPVDELATRAAVELPDRDELILVYCQSGMRAVSAVRTLTRLGYTKVYNFGGIMNWPYETVRG